MILLHGLGGNEDVMWVLETALPPGGLVAAPRGTFPSVAGGYSWSARMTPLVRLCEELAAGESAL